MAHMFVDDMIGVGSSTPADQGGQLGRSILAAAGKVEFDGPLTCVGFRVFPQRRGDPCKVAWGRGPLRPGG